MGRRAIMTHATPEAVYDDAALHIAATIGGAIERNDRAAIVLTGGSTVPPVYERLSADPTIDWERVDCFFSDERCVPPDDPRSNYGAARDALLEPAGVPDARIHRMRGEDEAAVAARAYETEIAGVLGAGPPAFDLLLLGVGADAHIASLFPHHPLLDEGDRLVGAVDASAFDVPDPAVDRVTLTPPAIRAARETLLIVTGERKAAAVRSALDNRNRDPRRWPAQIADGPDSRTTWLLDREAASALEA